MIVYFVAFICTLLFCYLSTKAKQNRQRKLFMVLSCLPFFIVSALRKNVGIDTWLNYGPTFDKVAQYGHTFDVLPFLTQKYEIGFSVLVWGLSKICKSSTILFTFGTAIIIFFTFATIYQESKMPWLSIIIFFLSGAFLLSMNGMRNYMAMAIVIFALKYIYDKKLLKYIIFILLAASLHKSALIFIVLYPLYNLKINLKQIIIVLLATVTLTFCINDILYFLLQKTSYANYFITDKVFIDPLYTMLIINILILAIFLLNYKNYRDDEKYNFYLKLQVLSVMVCIFSFKLSSAYRLEQIVDFLQIITIPYNMFLLLNNKNIKKKVAIGTIVLVITTYSAYFTKVFILSDDNQVRNYKSIFYKEE